MNNKRLNIKDMWNFKLVDDCWENDIPKYSAHSSTPTDVIRYSTALSIYKSHIQNKKLDFIINKYIYFTLENINKLRSLNIWYHYRFISKVASHFEGIISPYFACEYSNRIIRHNYNIYKMQTIGKYFTNLGQNVIYTFAPLYIENNNISLSGISSNSIIYIDIHNYENNLCQIEDFEKCYNELLLKKSPRLIILIGDKTNPRYEIIKNSNVSYKYFEDKKTYSFTKTIWQTLEENDKIFNKDGYPVCVPLKQSIPSNLISWTEARRIYKNKIKNDRNFKVDAYVHFYIDDQNFDGPLKGIWTNPSEAYELLKHFKGMITVDYSTYQDFPIPIKQFAIYRAALSGILANQNSIEVINSLRLDLFNSYPNNYIIDNNILFIGTVASNLKTKFYRDLFLNLLDKYFENHKWNVVLTFGSSNYSVFNNIKDSGTFVKSYISKKNSIFEGGDDNV